MERKKWMFSTAFEKKKKKKERGIINIFLVIYFLMNTAMIIGL